MRPWKACVVIARLSFCKGCLAAQVSEDMFAVADMDKDGNLSPDEFFDWASKSVVAKDLLEKCSDAEVRRHSAARPPPLRVFLSGVTHTLKHRPKSRSAQTRSASPPQTCGSTGKRGAKLRTRSSGVV